VLWDEQERMRVCSSFAGGLRGGSRHLTSRSLSAKSRLSAPPAGVHALHGQRVATSSAPPLTQRSPCIVDWGAAPGSKAERRDDQRSHWSVRALTGQRIEIKQ